MNAQTQISSASTLQKLYRVKALRQERRINEQMSVVATAMEEYNDSLNKVESLKTELNANSEFRNSQSVRDDVRRMVETLRYREHLEYNLERQSYYLLLATDELAAQQQELNVRKQALQKTKAKQEAITGIVRKQSAHAEFVRQDSLEEEIPFTNQAGGR